METVSDSSDVAIVGYGPVGALTALHLAGAGHRVVILERSTDVVALDDPGGNPKKVQADRTAGDQLCPLGVPRHFLAAAGETGAVLHLDDTVLK